MEQKQFIFQLQKSRLYSQERLKNVLVWKSLNLRSENGNQIVYVGYAKLICNMLVFFKYAHIYTSIQMHILSLYIYVTIIVTISHCQDIHADDSVSVTLRYLHKTITFYQSFMCTDTGFLEIIIIIAIINLNV